MNMSETPFFEWFWNDQPSEEKRQLVEKVQTYEDMFQDMIFESGTDSYELIQCKSKSIDGGDNDWVDDVAPRPDELMYFTTTLQICRKVHLT